MFLLLPSYFLHPLTSFPFSLLSPSSISSRYCSAEKNTYSSSGLLAFSLHVVRDSRVLGQMKNKTLSFHFALLVSIVSNHKFFERITRLKDA